MVGPPAECAFASATAKGLYPTALSVLAAADVEDGELPRTKVELEVQLLSGAFRAKPEWWRKVFDAEITERWKGEYGGPEERFAYALREAQYLATTFSEGPARPAAVDGVFSRDDLDEGLRLSLVESVAALRSRPAIGSTREDRHPGTPQMVDLVHPSLYAYERGVTPITAGDASVDKAEFLHDAAAGVEEAKESTTEERPPGRRGSWGRTRDETRLTTKEGLAWLPCEIRVSSSSECAINSYVNNLHPKKDAATYRALEKLFVHALPAFEEVLAELGHGDVQRERPARVEADPYAWYDGSDEPEMGDDGEWDDAAYEAWYENRPLSIPEVGDFDEAEVKAYYDSRPAVSLRDRPLQVIVKIASLELDNNNNSAGTFAGGTWHVEGVRDEHIVATACCYVDSENVRGGDLHFRTAVREPGYEQSDDRGVAEVYGLSNEEPLIQPRGHCTTPQGRVLAWPNTLQHKVDAVTLVDETKPGRRTIVCFFLVDPTLRIRSTATVPPQQSDWLGKDAAELLADKLPEKALRDLVASYVGGMTYHDAVERRERLMNERRAEFHEESDYYSGKFFERLFSLCEH
mmetsp:Transcript_37517/g.120395  ORF Transcript_37517/g.120395 Transcript_37517/m.120395 type:complete len:577 (-) Transcript_37517:1350-3080(-)